MAKFCSNCGEKLEDNAAFCPECGQKLEVQAEQINQPIQQASFNLRSRKIIPMIRYITKSQPIL